MTLLFYKDYFYKKVRSICAMTRAPMYRDRFFLQIWDFYMRSYRHRSDSTDSIAKQLSGAHRIGWDFDNTLIGHHASKDFWKYIERNPHNQEHFIITFRTNHLFDSVWLDLSGEGSRLRVRHFDGIFGVPEVLYRSFINGSPLRHRYFEWKGKQCRNQGISVLIDDATDHVALGCDRYGIKHIHPNELITEYQPDLFQT